MLCGLLVTVDKKKQPTIIFLIKKCIFRKLNVKNASRYLSNTCLYSLI